MPNEIDKNLTGDVVRALPIEYMIGKPLEATVKANILSCKSYVTDFLEAVCLDKDRKVKYVTFQYDEEVHKSDGTTSVATRTLRVPLMAIIEHPTYLADEGEVSFSMTINQMATSTSATSGEAGFKGSGQAGWGPVSVKVEMHGSVSHKSEQTRKTDTTAKYDISVKAKHFGQTETMKKCIDLMTNGTVPTSKSDSKSDDNAQDDAQSGEDNS